MDDIPVQGELQLMTYPATDHGTTLLRFPEGTKNYSFSLREIRFHFCLGYPTLHLCLRFVSQVRPDLPYGFLSLY
jgi:hypothetical protein